MSNQQPNGRAQRGNGQDTHRDEASANGNAAEQPILTTRQGHPVGDNQNVRTVRASLRDA